MNKKINTIQSFKAKADAKRTTADRFADRLTALCGSIPFLLINAVLFAIWIILNVGVLPGIKPFDPYPFGFLTMMVSLEAIFLAITVLISQNRGNRIAELREEVELYINTYSENEITKLIYLQTLLLKKSGIDVSQDKELQKMLQDLESEKIEQELERQM